MDSVGEFPEALRNSEGHARGFEYRPRADLIFHLVATQTHDAKAFPEIVAIVNRLLDERGNVLYPLALIEGARRGASDARVIVASGVANEVKDPFFDPLSFEAFQMFRWSEKYRAGSMAEAAARYVGAWLAYMQRHQHSPNSMDEEFRRVFEPFKSTVPDYPVLVEPELERLRMELGEEEYSRELIGDFQILMALVNHRTAGSIVDMTRNINGEVLLYCGENHRAAVEEAVKIYQASGDSNK